MPRSFGPIGFAYTSRLGGLQRALLLIFASALAQPASTTLAYQRQQRVVILYTSRNDVPMLADIEPVYERILREGMGEQLDYHTEYIDATRFSQHEYQKVLHDFLLSKYS